MLRIRFTNSAEADLLELWLTIAEENLVAADESLDSIQSTISLLATQPEMGRGRPELADGLHSFPTRTSYIIFYVLDKDGLLVVRMLHHARDVDADYFFLRIGIGSSHWPNLRMARDMIDDIKIAEKQTNDKRCYQ